MIPFATANQKRSDTGVWTAFTTLRYEVRYVCHKYKDGMGCELVKSLFCVAVTPSHPTAATI